MLVNIENKDFITTKTISKIDILDGNIQLNRFVSFPVRLMDSDDNVISIEHVSISGEEYNNWGSDDSYIETLILTKLGFQKLQ
jgi:hypothetical protein